MTKRRIIVPEQYADIEAMLLCYKNSTIESVRCYYPQGPDKSIRILVIEYFDAVEVAGELDQESET